MAKYIVEVLEDRTDWRDFDSKKLHRTDGPAVEYSSGTTEYWVNDKRHRLDGPAVEWANGDKEYWIDGKLHRVDGPAVEYSDGTKTYWVDGIRLTEKEFITRTTVKELTVADIEKLLGYAVKVVK